MTTVICKVDDRWYWGLENATMTFISPKGGFVRIDKFKMRNLNDKQCELVWDLKERVNSNQVEVTIEEMKQLVEIGNIAGSVYAKKSK